MTKRVAVVTGGLTGIGFASAKALLDAGHEVAVGSRRGEDDSMAGHARDVLGGKALIGKLNVTSVSSITSFLDHTNNRFGVPTLLVNAHGIFHEAQLGNHSDQAWFDQIDINLNGVFRMIRAIFPGMIAKNHGRIVNISSTAAHVGAAGYAAYCASKAGVNGLSKAVAVEGAPHNITCVSISPTFIETPMMENAVKRIGKKTGKSASEIKEQLKLTNPQDRLVQPEEVGALAAFCCSDEAPALTNEDIQINAGAVW
ncbi:MAG: SDR family NAD(P)-dependent oxidoreductase [Pseudomonadota bacterium]